VGIAQTHCHCFFLLYFLKIADPCLIVFDQICFVGFDLYFVYHPDFYLAFDQSLYCLAVLGFAFVVLAVVLIGLQLFFYS